jgi:GntR family transcriptional regulator, hexuronate regulon transcriptional repressor
MSRTHSAQKLYESVTNAIAEAIAAGRYAPGQKLPSERELTETFGVSRATVREAMIALAIRGLVEARHNAGVFVALAPPQPAQAVAAPDLDIGAFELTEARKLIEGEAAALAAKCITDEEVAQLYRLLGAMKHDFERDVMDDSADREFHFTIVRATRNAALCMVVETLWDLRYKAPLTREIFRRARTVGISAFVDDHRAVVDALRDRDAGAARAAMQAHLTHVMHELLSATETEAVQKAKDDFHRQRNALLRRSEER